MEKLPPQRMDLVPNAENTAEFDTPVTMKVSMPGGSFVELMLPSHCRVTIKPCGDPFDISFTYPDGHRFGPQLVV